MPTDATDAPPRRLRKRSPKIDREATVSRVLEALQAAQDERQEWLSKRLIRYAKLRGWLESRDDPWANASNAHLPVMMANSLRVKAGLYNAVLGIRPVMAAKPAQKTQKEAAERVDHLIDYQMFVESSGEKMVEKVIDGFVDDGTFVAFIHWVKDQRAMIDVRVFPTPDGSMVEAFPGLLQTIFPSPPQNVVMQDEDGYSWTAEVQGPDGEPVDVEMRVYDRDEDKIEVVLEWHGTLFDGPDVIVHELEDIVVPMRCENTQPVTPNNPFGAPWVARLIRIDLDTIKRRMEDGTYDLLTQEDFDQLAGEPRVPQNPTESREDAIRLEKERQEGRQSNLNDTEPDRQWVTMVEWYGRADMNGDGLDEDVVYWVLKEGELLCRAKYLGELYPGAPLTRPFADERYIPVKGQFYGIGLLELMEGLHDALHIVFNQAMDNGELANRPFGFYRASSGIKPEIVQLWPGDLYPVDNPMQDVMFPQMPHANQEFMFNMFGLLKQLLDDETQIGAIQRGQVPQGKASALRTLGTTMAILQQGAAMPEQILRRLFFGLRQVWECVHKLNTRYLPKNKNYLIAGKPLDQDDAYGSVKDPQDISIAVAFDFQATLLNTNKGVVSQALMGLGQALVNPLMLQAGLVGPEQIYNWAKDLIQAAQLDPARYIKRPAGVPDAPRILAEEAIHMLLDGKLPSYAPLEPPMEHFQKLQAFAQSPEFGLLHSGRELLFREYLSQALQGAQQAVQQQQMAQAAQQFSQMLGQGGAGQGGQPQGEAPPMQTQQATHAEIAGANGSHG